MLTDGLPGSLIYHDLNHTLDVTEQSLAIAREEGITDRTMLEDLEIASLYHDTGFLFMYMNHEDKGCELAREQLPAFGIDAQRIENICGLIMATKIPQSPKNVLGRIICDADLDYLGRNDFFETGDKLRRELIAYKFINDDQDWEERQISFLQTHEYFTQTSRSKRSAEKRKFIHKLVSYRKATTK
jgi:predicted metal-dependent HD superfamily phosphohydrolase